MPQLAYFGIESSGLSLVIDLLILFAVVVWGSLIYWTYADARRRVVDPMLIGCATAASLFPFVGTLVYLILRPPEYLEDVRERELEMQAAEARLHELDYSLCPHCDYRIERDFIRCPSCLRKLKERCVSCSRPLDRAWTICPYCETEVPVSSKPARRSSRHGRAAHAEPAPTSTMSLDDEHESVVSVSKRASVASRPAAARRETPRETPRETARAPEPTISSLEPAERPSAAPARAPGSNSTRRTRPAS